MTIANKKTITISEYEYREISEDEDGTVVIAERLAERRNPYRPENPQGVNVSILADWPL